MNRLTASQRTPHELARKQLDRTYAAGWPWARYDESAGHHQDYPFAAIRHGLEHHQMPTAPPILEAHHLGRREEADGEWLLQDISLDISAGDRIALVGSSGSGKTLLLRSLAMLDPCSTGEILLHGKPVRDGEIPHFRTQAIYLQQRPVLFEGTVEFNLQRPFELAVHREKRFDRGRILEWLEILERGESFLSKQQQNLSGGEAQLTALFARCSYGPRSCCWMSPRLPSTRRRRLLSSV